MVLKSKVKWVVPGSLYATRIDQIYSSYEIGSTMGGVRGAKHTLSLFLSILLLLLLLLLFLSFFFSPMLSRFDSY